MTEEKRTDDRRLTSWKEIASHLGVAVRTAQYWEKAKGLPVRRASPSSRSRVGASAAELDEWMAAQETAPTPSGSARAAWRLLLPAAGIAVIAAAAVWLLLGWASSPGPPFRGIVQGESLVLFDRSGRVCWTFEFDGLNEAAYQPVSPDGGIPKIDLLIVDIDADGREEILFRAQTLHVRDTGIELVCLESDGRERWRFKPGRPIEVAARKFSGAYTLQQLEPVRVGSVPYLLVNSRHFVFFPTQLALVDVKTGELAAEYWHPGEVVSMRLHDVDGDGTVELLAGGRNNPGDGIGHPSFMVLELPFTTNPQAAGGRNYFGSANAMETFYALLRNIPIYARQQIWASVEPIEILSDGRIRLTISSYNEPGGLLFTLDQSLQLLDARPTDELIRNYVSQAREQDPDFQLSAEALSTWGRMLVFPTAPDGNRQEIWDLFEGTGGWSDERRFGER